MGLRFIWYSL